MDPVENTTETRTITAEAEQHSGWWTARAVDENLPPATARSLTSVTAQLKKIAADLLKTSPEQIHLDISTELPAAVQELVDQAEEQRTAAETASAKARESLHAAAAQLKEEGWPTRDIASRLKLSSKTVTALTSSTADEDVTVEATQG